jgi:amino acid permease
LFLLLCSAPLLLYFISIWEGAPFVEQPLSALGLAFVLPVPFLVTFPPSTSQCQSPPYFFFPLLTLSGTGILTFNKVAAQLGWIPLVVCLVVCALFSTLAALAIQKTFLILKDFGVEVRTMGEAAFHTLGGKKAYYLFTGIVYGYALFGQASYLLILAQNIQSMFYEWNITTIVAVSISGAFLLPFMYTLKHVSQSTWVCFINLIVLIGVLVLGLGVIVLRGKSDDVVTELVAGDLTVNTFFQAGTVVLQSYAGHWMYFELLSAMERPKDFTKVLGLNMPIQLIFYAITAFITYAYVGKNAGFGGIIQEMPDGIASRIANALLFLHVAIIYVIKCVILISYVQIVAFPQTTWIGRKVHWRIRQIFISTFMVVCGSIFAVLIPYFYIFMGLVGAIFTVPITYLFPMMFYMGARGRYGNKTPDPEIKAAPLWSSEPLWYSEIGAFCFMWVLVLSSSVTAVYAQILALINLSNG